MQLAFFIFALIIMFLLAAATNPVGLFNLLGKAVDWAEKREYKKHIKRGHGNIPLDKCANKKCAEFVAKLKEVNRQLGR